MSGAFQTSREIFENPIWKNIVEFRLFFLIYGNAIFSEEGYRVSDDLILQRGQWLRSTRKIQDDLTYIENRQVKTYSTSVINRCIKKLEREQRICTKTHELGTVFTVINYNEYQGFGRYKTSNLEHNLEQYQNSVGTVEEQSGNNNKNGIKVNKEIKENKKDIPHRDLFEKFYETYPKREGRVDAELAWANMLKRKENPDEVITAAYNYAVRTSADGTEKKFMKLPSTFLNKDRWKEFLNPSISQFGTSYTNKMNDILGGFTDDEKE